jgi:hypothetical protein
MINFGLAAYRNYPLKSECSVAVRTTDWASRYVYTATVRQAQNYLHVWDVIKAMLHRGLYEGQYPKLYYFGACYIGGHLNKVSKKEITPQHSSVISSILNNHLRQNVSAKILQRDLL